MAAYAAVVSLHHTITAVLSSPRVSPIREVLEFALEEASSLLRVLERLDGSNRSRSSMEMVDALEGQIRDCAHKLEDLIEFHELKLEEEEEEEEGDEGAMRQEIRSFGEAAKRLEEEYLAELSRDGGGGGGDEDEATDSSSDIDFGVRMIGRSHLFKTILENDVLSKMRPDDRYVCTFFGGQGSGSRVVVKAVFENARVAGEFEVQGWVKVGRVSEVKQVLLSLIAQVVEDVDSDGWLIDASERRLSEYLNTALEGRRYMIVLDGVDDMALLKYLSFPDSSNGSVVLITTVSREVLYSSDIWSDHVIPEAFEDDFWMYARRVLFGLESIPAELEAAGKEILHNCRCLNVLIAKAIVFLCKSDKTVEQVEQVSSR